MKSKRGKYPRLELWRINGRVNNMHNYIGYNSFANASVDDISHEPAHKELLELIDACRNTKTSFINKLDKSYHIQPRLLFLKYTLLRDIPNIQVRNNYINKIIDIFPSFFGYELEKVIAVRHAYLMSIGYISLLENNCFINDDQYYHNIQKLCSFSDEQFCNYFSNELSSYTNFQEFKIKFLQGGLHAVRCMDMEMVKLLLIHGWCCEDEFDRSGRSSLMWACSIGNHNNSLAMTKLLLSMYNKNISLLLDVNNNTVMHWAVTSGSVDICKLLYYDFYCNVMSKNKDDTTPLHWAAGSGSLTILKWLIEYLHVHLHEKNKFGCTAAHFAASAGHKDICQYLYDQGIDFLEENYHGHDPLTKSVAFKQHHITLWLLEVYCSIIGENGLKKLLTKTRPWVYDTSSTHFNLENKEEIILLNKNNNVECNQLTLYEIAHIVGNKDFTDLYDILQFKMNSIT
eukprot:gene12268-16451_t